MTERDPFQNIIENMADEDYVTTEKDVDTYNPEDIGCAARLKLMSISFARAILTLLMWGVVAGLGVAVVSENLYDAGVIDVKIAFGEAFWIAVGSILIVAALREGSR